MIGTSMRRGAVAAMAALALLVGAVGTAAPASALSSVAYSVDAPDRAWVGQWIELGLACPTTCPSNVTSATVSVSGGPSFELPADPDYTVDWQVQGITAGDDDGIVNHTVTVTFTDETGSARTLTKTMRVDKDNPQYVEQLSPQDGTDARVTWQPPLIDGGSPVTAYWVRVDDDGDWVQLPSTARSFSLVGFPYGPHTVRVIAANAYGWGWGEPTTVILGVLPSAPVVTVTGTLNPTVSWTASTQVGFPVTGYTVYANGTAVKSVGPAVLSTTLTGLDPGEQEITVAADCWAGSGDLSTAVDWTQPTVPSAVDTPVVTADVESLDVSWQAPSSDGGLPVTSYVVRAVDPATRMELKRISAAGTSTTVTGLVSGYAVLVQVAAVNEAGQSGWTDAADPMAPTGPTTVASSLSLRASDTTPTTSQRVALSGVLSIAGRSETGQKVSVFLRPAGTSTWSLGGTVTVGSTGAWSWSRTFTRTTTVQVRYFGSASLDAKPATSSTLTVRPSVAVSARTTTVGGTGDTTFRLGSTVRVPVATVAAPTGAKASLQRKSGTSWVTIASKALSGGKATFQWKPSKRATYTLRVVVSGSSTVSTGYSRLLGLSVS